MISKHIALILLIIALLPTVYGDNFTFVVDNVDDGLEDFVAQDYEAFAYQYSAENDIDGDGYTFAIDCDDNNADIHPGQDEFCNNIDDDCDGNIDEGLVRNYGSNMGQCLQGTQRCILGDWVIIDPELGPTKEICDGLDNDCDGTTDEMLVKNHPNQNGACVGNTLICEGGLWIDDDTNYLPHEELCDNLDNDCDSLVDEDLNERTDNQKGLCFGNTETCVGGVWIGDFGNYIPENESCDRTDNDCDGFVDENFDLDFDEFYSGEFCTLAYYSELDCDDGNKGINPAKREICGDNIDQDCDGKDIACNFDGDGDGYTYILDCNDDNPFIHPNIDEVCDNVDNNCDGNIDEGLYRDSPTQQGQCSGNKQQCVRGSWVGVQTNFVPSNETCDGIDNDCDGQIDEELIMLTPNQLGLCDGNYQLCDKGFWINYFANYQPTAEILDNRDNDCDGSIDEDTAITFELITNKETYSLNDDISITIIAPDNSSVNVSFVRADGTTEKYSHSGDFPHTFVTNNVIKVGTHRIISEMNYLYKKETISKNIEVVNSMTAEIGVADYNDLSTEKDVSLSGGASGGTAPYTYKWDLGDGVSASGVSVKHRYLDVKSYNVKLQVTDAENNVVNVERTIRVQDRFVINFQFVDEEDSDPIENLRVKFDDEIKTTDSMGEVSFERIKGKYDLVVDSSDYTFKKENIEITGRYSTKYTLSFEDNLKPTLDIISPVPSEVIKGTAGSIIFRVIDQSMVDCALYQNQDSKYWEYLGSIEEIENTNRQTFNLEDLEVGQNMFKLECVDKSDNIIDKDIIMITEVDVEEIEEVIVEEDNTKAEMHAKISELEAKAREVADTLGSSIDEMQQLDQMVKTSGIYSQIESGKSKFTKLARDLFALKNSEQEGLEEKYNSFNKQYDDLIANTPKSVIVKDKYKMELQMSDNIEELTKEYLEQFGLDSGVVKGLIKDNAGLNKDKMFEVEAITLEVTYLGNTVSDFTVITKTVSLDEGQAIIESFDKNILDDASKIITQNSWSIIKKDPIVLFKPDSGKIIYAVPTTISQDMIQNIKTIITVEDFEKTENSGIGITGFFTKVGESGNAKFYVETGLILLLLGVYLLMQFDIRSWFGDKRVKEVKKMIKTAKKKLAIKEHDAVEKIYKDLMLHYVGLSTKHKKKIYPHTDHIFNEMKVVHIHNLIDNVKKYLSTKEHDFAKASYLKMQELYSQLPGSYKTKVSARSLEIHKQISEVV